MVSKSALSKKSSKPAKPAKKQAANAAAAKAAAVKKSAKPAPKPVKLAKAAKHPAKPVKVVHAKSVPAKAGKAKPEPELKAKKGLAAKPDTKAAAKPAAAAQAVKPVAKIVPKKPGENETPGDADSPLLDMSDVGVRKMIARAKQRGYVTYDELNKVLPSDKTSSEQIEDTMAMLNEMGINVIESEEAEEGAEETLPAVMEGKALATTPKSG